MELNAFKTKNYTPSSGHLCAICGSIHRKWQKRCELKRLKTCADCGEAFLAHEHTIFCSHRCCDRAKHREAYYRNRMYVPQPVRLSFCAACGNTFCTRTASQFYCSDECWHEKEKLRWRTYDEQNQEKRKAYHRDYSKRNREILVARSVKWRRENPDKIKNQPAVIRARVEAQNRAEQRRQDRDRHAGIMEASRQMEAMRWHIYGDGWELPHGGRIPFRTVEEKKEQRRKLRRARREREKAAAAIFRELSGHAVAKKDRSLIYSALRDELFNREAKP